MIKPSYSTLVVLGCIFLLGVLAIIVSMLMPTGLDIGLLLGIIVMIPIFALIELFGFMCTIEFHQEEMTINSGGGNLFRFPSKSIRYDQIRNITEHISVRKKFSNLKIQTENKQYIIFISGVQNYDQLKSELTKWKKF